MELNNYKRDTGQKKDLLNKICCYNKMPGPDKINYSNGSKISQKPSQTSAWGNYFSVLNVLFIFAEKQNYSTYSATSQVNNQKVQKIPNLQHWNEILQFGSKHNEIVDICF